MTTPGSGAGPGHPDLRGLDLQQHHHRPRHHGAQEEAQLSTKQTVVIHINILELIDTERFTNLHL